MGEFEIARAENILVQLRHRDLQALHDFQHVRAGFALDVQRNDRFAVTTDDAVGLLVAEPHLGDVAHVDRSTVDAR